MRAMLLKAVGEPLFPADLPPPTPGPGEVLLRVEACGVCRTDQHIADGELPPPRLPLVLGHQAVGRVAGLGEGVVGIALGTRLGVGWLGGACGACKFCLRGQENLCPGARFTGYHRDGGYAEYLVVRAEYAYPLPEDLPPEALAPWLCAGLIGYRAYRMVQDRQVLGFYGFGAAAHLLLQVARHEGKRVYAFVRPGDEAAKALALELGAFWAGDSTESPPEPLEAALVFAPVGSLVPKALADTEPGGVVVLAGIHMSPIPEMPYRLLWEERVLRSVANLTREDAKAFLEIAPKVPVRAEVEVFPLEEANRALEALRRGRLRGAAVLLP
ncbi:zinc-dependent alcohol dehydrogenase family protein [Thermus thermamylovorans]|uniref:Zinc-binding alcohol dehydrogenase family protein n=1 Tax=Thermus thermamylovorans TaxID=2509362 RepID=A0A4Q9B4A5_9DEIN|nr:zinc-dependent alcohol dehydrogenase family protein [Thermus thermamylovorans]TBH20467.1 zinc-binding alcohol dehydrogenase family protein [Thermus thermamylovorans]